MKKLMLVTALALITAPVAQSGMIIRRVEPGRQDEPLAACQAGPYAKIRRRLIK
jgi:hypothetical protein